jgi:hypothetical protein
VTRAADLINYEATAARDEYKDLAAGARGEGCAQEAWSAVTEVFKVSTALVPATPRCCTERLHT